MSRTEGGKLNPRMSLKKLVHCVSLQLIHIEKFSCFAWNTSLCVRNRCFSVQKIEICTVWKDFSPSYNGIGPPQRSLDVEVRPRQARFHKLLVLVQYVSGGEYASTVCPKQ